MDYFDVDKLMMGAIDMHMHPGPAPGPCRVDAIEAARQALQVGMRAIVIKSHDFPTAALAVIVNQVVPGIRVFGSVCLDNEVGGLNYYALQNAARFGAKVVWMPTFSSTNSINKMRALGLPIEGEGFPILDDEGKLVLQMEPILALIKRYDMVMATGHLSPQEIFVLVKEAQKIGIKKIVVTHPTDGEFSEKLPSLQELQQLAKMGAFIEFTLVGMLPTEFMHDPARIAQIIKAIGPGQCIISTDLGQPLNPTPVEGLRLLMGTLFHHGLKPEEIEQMVKVNPAKLLGLD
jgi:imidazolonepropionase-like amidohydrolase